ncbi:aminotransferase class I/II-fold pyridoxal phosphate-dependent enzyme [Elioraea sp.]|uniref:aminotransferase class I/II-fold pyridoxal phosphate-dependent enzyme n=1 Tax=Elioraea sp. TaxID=2185103 RepID=UPI003F6F7D43
MALTNGGFGAIELMLKLFANPGEEIIHSRPSWFCYAPMTHLHGLVPVAVPMRPGFGLDIEAILAAVTPRTRLIVVNTPHNPSGTIASEDALAGLGARLERINVERQPIRVLSDEAYREIVFSDGRFAPPLRHIRRSATCDSDGKRLLTPGRRLGSFAVNPAAPERADAVRGRRSGAAGDRHGGDREPARPARGFGRVRHARRDLRRSRPRAALAHRERRDGGGRAGPFRPRRGGAARGGGGGVPHPVPLPGGEGTRC